MIKKSISVIATLLLSGVSGCATIFPSGVNVFPEDTERNSAGVRNLLVNEQLRTIDLAGIVYSFAPDTTVTTTTTTINNNTATLKNVNSDIQLNHAIGNFYKLYNNSDNSKKDESERKLGLLRDEIQGRIMAAANQRCGLWKNYFSSSSSQVGFWTGSAGTAFGAASIAFTENSTKTALSAISSTLSGAGTQYEKNFLFNQTMSVIFLGIDNRRELIALRIKAKRYGVDDASKILAATQTVGISDYPLSSAIADALEYHAACSAASGLQRASEALVSQRNSQDDKKDVAPQGAHNIGAPNTTTPPAGNKSQPESPTQSNPPAENTSQPQTPTQTKRPDATAAPLS